MITYSEVRRCIGACGRLLLLLYPTILLHSLHPMPEHSESTYAHYDLPSREEEVVKNPSIETQIMIDQHIASLEVDPCALRTMRNHCSSILSLPAETLADILVTLVEPVDLYTPQGWRNHVELTRVCTHWRNVAMQCPAYWACPPLTHVKGPVSRLEEMLARSQDYPISIRMDIVCTPSPAQPTPNAILAPNALITNDHNSDSERIGTGPMLSLLQAEVYRIRELHLKSEIFEIDRFQCLLAEDTPVLESLDIRLTRPTSSQFEPIMFEAPGMQSRFTLDYVLNTHTMPSLRYLRLNYRVHPINWTTAPPSSRSYLSTQNLTTLILSTDSKSRDAAPPWALLPDIIRASAPHLQTLHLSDCIANNIRAFRAEVPTTPARHKIHLPCLTSIKIQERLFPLVSFLSWIILPLHGLDIDLSVVGRLEDSISLRDPSTYIRDLLLCCGLKSQSPMGEVQVQRIGLGGDASLSVRRYEVMNLVIDRADTVHLRLFDRVNADACSPNADFGTHSSHDKTSLSLKFFNVRHTTSLVQHLDLGTLPYCEGGGCPSEVQLIYSNVLDLYESDPDYDNRPPVNWVPFFSRYTSIQTLTLRAEEEDFYEVVSALRPVGPGSSGK